MEDAEIQILVMGQNFDDAESIRKSFKFHKTPANLQFVNTLAEAHRQLEGRETVGKILLTP